MLTILGYGGVQQTRSISNPTHQDTWLKSKPVLKLIGYFCEKDKKPLFS